MRRALQLAGFLCLSLVLGFSAQAQDLSTLHVGTAKVALEALEKGDWRRAESHARATGSELLETIVTWRKLTDANAPKADFSTYAGFVNAHPDWPRQSVLLARAEMAMEDDVSDAAALSWFEIHPPVTGRGKLRRAEALYRSGDREQGAALLREVWINEDFDSRTERDLRRRYGTLLTRDDHEARLRRLLSDRQATAARRMLPLVPSDVGALGEARVRLITMSAGVDGAIRRVPAHLIDDPGLVFDRAIWRRRKGRQDESLALIAALTPPVAQPSVWWKERAVLARYGVVAGQAELAYTVAAHHGLTEGEDYADAEWLAGWIALRYLDDPRRAAAHFERLYNSVQYPISRSRGAYWAGRAAAAMGRADEARQWYRLAAQHVTSFYGELAMVELHELGESVAWTVPEPPPPTDAERKAFYAREPVRAVRLLGVLGFKKAIDPFIRDLSTRATSAGEHALISAVAEEAGRFDLSVLAARIAIRGGVVSLERGFPTAVLAEIKDIEGSEGIEPALLLALMRQESGFKVDAVSSAGARGLMQLMPATARVVARKIGVSYAVDRLHTDPPYNVRLGRAYLADMLQRFGGSYVLALAAYNAGPNRVSAWLARHGDPRTGTIDAIDWIELIPFTETRDYVQRVLENLFVYRQILEPHDSWGRFAHVLHREVRPAIEKAVDKAALTTPRGMPSDTPEAIATRVP